MARTEKLTYKEYDRELWRLQTELVYMQEWIVAKKKRMDDPRKRSKFSPDELQARARWADYEVG